MITEDDELTVSSEDYNLLTDLYQLTMTACYTGEGIQDTPACFEMFVRRLPEDFGYLIAMGLAQVLDYLEKLHFSSSQIEALQKTGIFAHVPDKFWQVLESARFRGDVWAVPEGTAIFAQEPILRVEAPLWQAQLVETYILNTVNYQTLIATRAARIREAAGEKANLLEFGTRRAFSPQGALWAGRAALAGGLDSTSNVLAALKLGRKPSGTMAHSLVMAIGSLAGGEDEAFSAFQRYFPQGILLIDTYDTVAAAERLAEKVRSHKIQLAGVRLDSGDLVELSQKVRSLLPEITIFASGDLDEKEITRLKQAGATIDGYGIGTKLVTGTPVNGVYKLVEIDGIPTMKKSTDKISYPGRKQIFRTLDKEGIIQHDRLGLATETPDGNEQTLLQVVMKKGEKIKPSEGIDNIRQRVKNSVATIAKSTKLITNPHPIKVEISQPLITLTNQLSNLH
jgi:nicotinate phosphoribosyltransferase